MGATIKKNKQQENSPHRAVSSQGTRGLKLILPAKTLPRFDQLQPHPNGSNYKKNKKKQQNNPLRADRALN